MVGIAVGASVGVGPGEVGALVGARVSRLRVHWGHKIYILFY